jgi:hypothetical protein
MKVLDVAPLFANMAPSLEICPVLARAPYFTSIVLIFGFVLLFI